MGAPKGNQYAKGNPGGGRPSAYKERQDAEWHELVWKSVQDVSELENKIATKKYAGRDIAALRLLKGDKYLIGKFMDKLVPNKLDITSDGKALPQPILNFLNEKVDRDQSTESELG